MTGHENCFQFDKDFDTSTYISVSIGRLHLASGNCVRIVFCKEGLKLIVGKSSLDNGDIIAIDGIENFITPLKKGDGK